MIIRQLVLAFFTLASASAIAWDTTTVDSSPEVGAVSASTIDAAGRVHLVDVFENGVGNFILTYLLRSNGTDGVSSVVASGALVANLPPEREPVHVSMDVRDDFMVQVAVVDASGVVTVYERENFSNDWSESRISVNGSVESDGGICLRSRGDNGAAFSSLVYTRFQADGSVEGTDSGGVQYAEQGDGGSWGAPVDLFTGLRTGLAPVLVNTGLSTVLPGRPRRMVVFYNQAEEEVQSTGYQKSVVGGVLAWSVPAEVAPARTFTRPDASAHRGTVGVAFVSDGAGSTQENIVRVQYVAKTYGALITPWEREDVAPGSEVNGDDGEFFNGRCGLAFDAVGNPWVAYQRDVFVVFVGRTLDVRARRFVPGVGWELSVVDEMPSGGLGFYASGGLALCSGVNGDLALTYERDGGTGGANSEFVLARPVSAPWVVGKPEALEAFGYTSAPALLTSADGTEYLVANVGDVNILFGTSVPLYKAPAVISTRGGSSTIERLPSTESAHHALAIAETSDGSLHVMAVRTATNVASEGSLRWFVRPPGGSFVNDLTSPADGNVSLAPICLETSAAGTLYCAYVPLEGGVMVKRLDPGVGWTQVARVNTPAAFGMDLAVRGDGGVALSYFRFTGGDVGDVRLLTNIDAGSGAQVGVFSDTIVQGMESVPRNTSCVIARDGLPRIAYAARNRAVYLAPDGGGGFSSNVVSGAGEFPDGTVEMLERSGMVHLAGHTSEDGGTLRYVSFHDSEVGGLGAASAPFSSPGLALRPTGALDDVMRYQVALTLDKLGEPVMAASVREPRFAGSFVDHLVVARPADGLDLDGDGIPLLAEEAYCLDPWRVDDVKDLPAEAFTINPTFLDMRILFTVPRVPLIERDESLTFGEFAYHYEAGSDLAGWVDEVSVDDAIFSFLFPPFDIEGRSDCWRTGRISQYEPEYMVANPRRFLRLRVSRDR